MKITNKITKLTSVLFLSLMMLVSCSDEDPITSRVTSYPTFDITGGQYMIVEIGNTYTEPGITALEGTTSIEVTTTGTVDTSSEGIYPITYSATNSDGFDGTITRYVLVTPNETEIRNNDLSGTYWRSNNSAREVTISKVADGFYHITDAFPTNGIPVTFGQTSTNILVVWNQSSGFGPVVADQFNDPATAGIITDSVTLGWNMRVGGFGVFGITFNKQ